MGVTLCFEEIMTFNTKELLFCLFQSLLESKPTSFKCFQMPFLFFGCNSKELYQDLGTSSANISIMTSYLGWN